MGTPMAMRVPMATRMQWPCESKRRPGHRTPLCARASRRLHHVGHAGPRRPGRDPLLPARHDRHALGDQARATRAAAAQEPGHPPQGRALPGDRARADGRAGNRLFQDQPAHQHGFGPVRPQAVEPGPDYRDPRDPRWRTPRTPPRKTSSTCTCRSARPRSPWPRSRSSRRRGSCPPRRCCSPIRRSQPSRRLARFWSRRGGWGSTCWTPSSWSDVWGPWRFSRGPSSAGAWASAESWSRRPKTIPRSCS